MEEVNYERAQMLWKQHDVVVTLLHTPICGTCQLAKRMLVIVAKTLPSVEMIQVNLNFNEQLATDYEILSVPCLLIHKNNDCVEKVYAFESVPKLYEKIKTYVF